MSKIDTSDRVVANLERVALQIHSYPFSGRNPGWAGELDAIATTLRALLAERKTAMTEVRDADMLDGKPVAAPRGLCS